MAIKISQLNPVSTVWGNVVVPLVSAISGANVTYHATVDQVKDYVTANVNADIVANIANVNAALTQANTSMRLYVDGQIFASNTATSTANTAMQGYVDQSNLVLKNYVDGQIIASNVATLNANVGMIGFVNQSNLVLKNYVDGQIAAANAGVVAANLGMQGYVDRANTIQNTQITQANLGMQGYVDLANTIQSQQITQANLGVVGYVDLANTIQNNQILQANIGIIGFVNQSNLVLKNYVDGQIAAANAGVVAANLGMQGYVDLANTIQSQQITQANLGLVGYVDLANTIQNNQILQANIGIIGYIDFANTIQSQQITQANLGLVGYVDQANTIQNTQITQANVGMVGFVNQSNTVLRSYVDGQITAANTSSYTNAKVLTYLTSGVAGNIIPSANLVYSLGSPTNQWKDIYVSGNTIFIGGTALSVVAGNLIIGNTPAYSNVQVAAYLPTYSGNVANVRLSPSGVLTFADGTTMITAASGTAFGNVNVAAYLNTQGYNLYSNVNVAAYLISTGYVNTNSAYSNANVASYFAVYNGNIGNVRLSPGGFIYFPDGSVQTTAPPTGGSAYGNVNVAAYLNTQGYNLYSNVNVSVLLSNTTVLIANLQLGPSGNIAFADGTKQTTAVTLPLRATSGVILSSNIAIGDGAGIISQAGSAVAIGHRAGANAQGFAGIAIGIDAGNSSQGQYSIAIGPSCGETNQGQYSTALGQEAAQTSQGTLSTAIGRLAGRTSQGTYAVALGDSAGRTSQGNNSVALGSRAGFRNLGDNSVAIGVNAGYWFTPANTIIINADSSNLSPSNSGVYVNPMREISSANILYYNTVTKEISYGPVAATYSNANVASYLISTQIVIANIRIAPSGNIVFPDGSIQTSAASGTGYSNVNVASYLNTQGYNLYSNVNVIAYLGSTQVAVANIRLLPSGNLMFPDGSVQTTAAVGGGGSYGNVNVAAYLGGNVLIGNLTSGSANITLSTPSINAATGTLRVMGGAGIAGNLNVGAGLTVANVVITNPSAGIRVGNLTIVEVFGNTQKLAIGGGSGFNIETNIGANINLSTSGGWTLMPTAKVTDSTAATSTNSGAFTVAGGVGIGGSIFAGGDLTINRIITGTSGSNLTLKNALNGITLEGGINGHIDLSGANVIIGQNSQGNVSIFHRSMTFQQNPATIYAGTAGTQLLTVQGNLTVFRALTAAANVASTSNTTGAFLVTGGAGVTGNVFIAGGIGASGTLGTTGQVLQSTGTGIQWVTPPSGNIIQNGTSNVSIPTSNGNVFINSTNVTINSRNVVIGAGTGGAGNSLAGNLQATGITTLGVIGQGFPFVQINGVFEGSDTVPGSVYCWFLNALQDLRTPGSRLTNTTNQFILDVNVTPTTQSISANTGAILVAGGAGIRGNLYVGGGLGAGNTLGIAGQFLQSTGNGIQWTSSTTGSLIQNGTSNVSIPASNGNILYRVNNTSIGQMGVAGLTLDANLNLSGGSAQMRIGGATGAFYNPSSVVAGTSGGTYTVDAISGTVAIGPSATSVSIGGPTTFSSNVTVSGSTDVSAGVLTISTVTEEFTSCSSAGSSYTIQYSGTGSLGNALHYWGGITSNVTIAFTNVPTANGFSTTYSILINQGANVFMANAVTINGTSQTINWLGYVAPTGNANKKDLVSFSLMRTSGTWTILGSLSSYG